MAGCKYHHTGCNTRQQVEWRNLNAIVSNVYAFGGNLTPSLTYSKAQSNTSKGMTKKLLCEFDPKGWSQL